MLQYVREKSSSKASSIFLIILAFSMGLWGISSFFNVRLTNTDIAQVGKNSISKSQFSKMLRRAQLSQDKKTYLAIQQNPEFKLFFKQRLLSEMLYNLGSENGLQHYGYTIDDNLVREAIFRTPLFQSSGSFNINHYHTILSQLNISENDMIREVRLNLILEKIKSAFLFSKFLLSGEKKLMSNALNERRNVQVIKIIPSEIKVKFRISEKSINNLYNENLDKFTTKPFWQVNYIEIFFKDLQKNMQVDDNKSRLFYQNHPQQFTISPKIKTQQFIFSKNSKPDDNKKISLLPRRLHDAARNMIKNGYNISYINNQRWLSKPKNGPVYESLRSLKVGQTSDFITLPNNNFVVIKLTDYQKSKLLNYADVKNKITKNLLQKQFNNIVESKLDKLSTSIYANERSLIEAAHSFNTKVKTTKFYTSDNNLNSGIMKNKKVIEFMNSKFLQNINSDVIKLKDRWIVINPQKFSPKTTLALKKVRSEVTQLLQQKLLSQHVQEILKLIKLELNSGIAADKVASKYQAHYKMHKNLSRLDNNEFFTKIGKAKILLDKKIVYKPTSSYYSADKINNHIESLKNQLAKLDLGLLRKDLLLKQKIKILVSDDEMRLIN